MGWDSTRVHLSNFVSDSYCITGYVSLREGSLWWLTVVYGPQEDDQKIMFLQELSDRRMLCPGSWLVIGDFNLILNVADKNNTLLNCRMMGKFKRFVDDNALKEFFFCMGGDSHGATRGRFPP